MKTIELFIQMEGVKDIILARVLQNGLVKDIIHSAKEHGLDLANDESLYTIFIEDGEEAINQDISLESAGIHQRGHVHIHRCKSIHVTVNYNAQQITRNFSPSTTVKRVKKWATKEFNLTDEDATEHALQIVGTTERPDEDVHIGTLVIHPACRISFDLVAKIRVEG
ncbi:MAG: hypothetical protein ABR911_07710 [Syntrophales bacterium]